MGACNEWNTSSPRPTEGGGGTHNNVNHNNLTKEASRRKDGPLREAERNRATPFNLNVDLKNLLAVALGPGARKLPHDPIPPQDPHRDVLLPILIAHQTNTILGSARHTKTRHEKYLYLSPWAPPSASAAGSKIRVGGNSTIARMEESRVQKSPGAKIGAR